MQRAWCLNGMLVNIEAKHLIPALHCQTWLCLRQPCVSLLHASLACWASYSTCNSSVSIDQGKKPISFLNAELLQKSCSLMVPTPPLVHGMASKTAAKCHQTLCCQLALSYWLTPLHLEAAAFFVKVPFMELHISFPFLFLSLTVMDNWRWQMMVITAWRFVCCCDVLGFWWVLVFCFFFLLSEEVL